MEGFWCIGSVSAVRWDQIAVPLSWKASRQVCIAMRRCWFSLVEQDRRKQIWKFYIIWYWEEDIMSRLIVNAICWVPALSVSPGWCKPGNSTWGCIVGAHRHCCYWWSEASVYV
jgi:hypothetical protein